MDLIIHQSRFTHSDHKDIDSVLVFISCSFRTAFLVKPFPKSVSVTVLTGNYYDEQLPSSLNKVRNCGFKIYFLCLMETMFSGINTDFPSTAISLYLHTNPCDQIEAGRKICPLLLCVWSQRLKLYKDGHSMIKDIISTELTV